MNETEEPKTLSIDFANVERTIQNLSEMDDYIGAEISRKSIELSKQQMELDTQTAITELAIRKTPGRCTEGYVTAMLNVDNSLSLLKANVEKAKNDVARLRYAAAALDRKFGIFKAWLSFRAGAQI